MNVQITKKVETHEIVNIELPAYFQNKDKQFKIIAEKEMIEVYAPSESGKWGYAYKVEGIFAENDIKNTIQEGEPSNEDNFFNALRLVYKSVNDLIREENQVTV